VKDFVEKSKTMGNPLEINAGKIRSEGKIDKDSPRLQTCVD